MTLKELPKQMRKRVHDYFELIWEAQVKLRIGQQRQTIDQLPPSLKNEVLKQMSFLRRNCTLLSHFSLAGELETTLAETIQRTITDKGSKVFSQNCNTQSTLILHLHEGLVKFYFQFQFDGKPVEKCFALSNVGKTFGLYEMLTKQAYCFSARTLELCTIDSLSLQDLRTAIESLHLEEEFFTLRDAVKNDKDISLIRRNCFICLETHLESQCPNLFPKAHFKQSTNASSSPHQRDRKYRRLNSKQNSEKFINIRQLMHPFLAAMSEVKISNTRIEEVFSYMHYHPQYNYETIFK